MSNDHKNKLECEVKRVFLSLERILPILSRVPQFWFAPLRIFFKFLQILDRLNSFSCDALRFYRSILEFWSCLAGCKPSIDGEKKFLSLPAFTCCFGVNLLQETGSATFCKSAASCSHMLCIFHHLFRPNSTFRWKEGPFEFL